MPPRSGAPNEPTTPPAAGGRGFSNVQTPWPDFISPGAHVDIRYRRNEWRQAIVVRINPASTSAPVGNGPTDPSVLIHYRYHPANRDESIPVSQMERIARGFTKVWHPDSPRALVIYDHVDVRLGGGVWVGGRIMQQVPTRDAHRDAGGPSREVIEEALQHRAEQIVRVSYSSGHERASVWVPFVRHALFAAYESRSRQEVPVTTSKTHFWEGRSRTAALPHVTTAQARLRSAQGSSLLQGGNTSAALLGQPGGDGPVGVGGGGAEGMEEEGSQQASAGAAMVRHYVEALARRGLQVVPMGADGNCLFRSVSDQVYGTQELHTLVRAAAAEYMKVEAPFFRPFVVGGDSESAFLSYVSDIRRDGVWGDEPEVQALCEVYNRPAEIWAYDAREGAQRVRVFNSAAGERASDRRPPIRLSYYGGGHYDSVRGRDWEANCLSLPPGVHEERTLIEARRRQEAAAAAAARVSSAAAPAGSGEEGEGAEEEGAAAVVDEVRRASREEFMRAKQLELELLEQIQLGNAGSIGRSAGAGSSSSSTAAPSASAGPGGAGPEQAMLAAAIRESLASAPPAGQSSAAMAVEEDEEALLQAALRESLAGSLPPPPSSSSSLPGGDTNALYDAALELTEEEQMQCALLGVTAAQYAARKREASSSTAAGAGVGGGGGSVGRAPFAHVPPPRLILPAALTRQAQQGSAMEEEDEELQLALLMSTGHAGAGQS